MELLFLFVPITWWHNKTQYEHGSDPLNICEFIEVVGQFLGKVYLPLVFMIQIKKGGGLWFVWWWSRHPWHMVYWYPPYTEHDQLQSLIRVWWVHWIQYPHHDVKINKNQIFDQGQFEQQRLSIVICNSNSDYCS